MRTTTLPWVSSTWSTSLKRWWTSSWCSNSTSGHATDLILVSNPWFLGARNHFGPFPEALDSIEGQEWVCPESEFLHEELHHLLREGDHVVDTHGNVVVRTKRDHFSKYAPKRSNHANFQPVKIKNKKVMTKNPLIVENTNPLIRRLFHQHWIYPRRTLNWRRVQFETTTLAHLLASYVMPETLDPVPCDCDF